MVGKMKQNKGLEHQKNRRADVVAFLCQVSEVVAKWSNLQKTYYLKQMGLQNLFAHTQAEY